MEGVSRCASHGLRAGARSGSEEVAEKKLERRAMSIPTRPDCAKPSSIPSSKTHRHSLKKGRKTCVRSGIKQEAWGRDLFGFLLLREHPDRKSQSNNERKKGSYPCKAWVDSAFIFSFQGRTCPVFLFFPWFVVSLFYTLAQASSPILTGLS